MAHRPTSRPSKGPPTLDSEYVRIQTMMSGLTISWPMHRINRTTLAEIEQGAQRSDPVLVAARRDLIRWFGKVNKVQEFGPIAQALTAADAGRAQSFRTLGPLSGPAVSTQESENYRR
jgi:hypothetical protein